MFEFLPDQHHYDVFFLLIAHYAAFRPEAKRRISLAGLPIGRTSREEG
jgi:hypothetical protein